MLKDNDRIFTNLYGFADAGLAAARTRGDWHETKSLSLMKLSSAFLTRQASFPIWVHT